ncbi:hypothetical protein [Glaciimonas sp. PCH181]|uniref:hypothetical protein n=1 Tax=Glaciimonas sp. PCH181 TaxID=2133943 RepID=UPI000D35E352|nr:hypothetical protein [Glaciimonas sp. PCH181]PUA19580.1 hypothetical protein C7W93_06965 [Glaciimonas sp. PCH181]
MTKITLKETPTQEVLAKANEESTVIDALGRTIKIKKPGVLAQYRLIEALGDSAKNQTYMGMVLPLIYVTAIDDLAVNQPKTKLQVEALIQQLDESGIEAVMNHVQEKYGNSDPEKDKEELKN